MFGMSMLEAMVQYGYSLVSCLDIMEGYVIMPCNKRAVSGQ